MFSGRVSIGMHKREHEKHEIQTAGIPELQQYCVTQQICISALTWANDFVGGQTTRNFGK